MYRQKCNIVTCYLEAVLLCALIVRCRMQTCRLKMSFRAVELPSFFNEMFRWEWWLRWDGVGLFVLNWIRASVRCLLCTCSQISEVTYVPSSCLCLSHSFYRFTGANVCKLLINCSWLMAFCTSLLLDHSLVNVDRSQCIINVVRAVVSRKMVGHSELPAWVAAIFVALPSTSVTKVRLADGVG